MINLTVTKGLSSLYLNFININYLIDSTSEQNKEIEIQNKDGLQLVEMISVYMQIIDDLSDFNDDKNKGISTSI